MPTVHNWEEWDEVEEKLQNEHVREKINVKNKTQKRRDKKQNDKISKKLQENTKST
tara:strand:- start:3837 stop:4004 length:168 start_codon:yes stop_codon:yes gene_type:complete